MTARNLYDISPHKSTTMNKLLFLFFAIIISYNSAHSQEYDPYVSTGFLIILSTKNYEGALKLAKEACTNLSLDFNSRGLYADAELGLNSDEICGCGETHGYIARGRSDDGNYISIEYTDAYETFSDGYYIVVVASGKRSELKPTLKKVKQHYKDAYIKNSDVYIGCMH